MGHKFAERCGHMLQGETVDEADEPPAEVRVVSTGLGLLFASGTTLDSGQSATLKVESTLLMCWVEG